MPEWFFLIKGFLRIRDASPNDRSRTGFPTFRARNSIICRYGPGLVPSPRRKKGHTPVNCRQVRVHRRHGQELLPFPWHQSLRKDWILLTVTIYAQAATGRPLLTTDHNVFNVRCGVAGNPSMPVWTYSLRKNRAPMFWAADRSQLYILQYCNNFCILNNDLIFVISVFHWISTN